MSTEEKLPCDSSLQIRRQNSTGTSSQLASLRISENFLTDSTDARSEEQIQVQIEDKLINQQASVSTDKSAPIFTLRDLLPFVRNGVGSVVQDDFSRCFQSRLDEPWNWNPYLFVLWSAGVFFRYCILFPIRLISLLVGFGLFLAVFFTLPYIVPDKSRRERWERYLIRSLCALFCFSWTAVLRYHGTVPARQPGRIFVANHTSIIDMIVLSSQTTFSVVGQFQPGWVGFCQKRVLASLGCVWFSRAEAGDRQAAARKFVFTDRLSSHLLVSESMTTFIMRTRIDSSFSQKALVSTTTIVYSSSKEFLI